MLRRRASEKVKLLAQFCYEMNASGDYGRALKTIREFVARYPRDVDGMKGLALALRVQGLLPEALQAAERGYGEHPFDAETYAEAELAMIGMDRYDDALQLEAQAQHVGVLPSWKCVDRWIIWRERKMRLRARVECDAGCICRDYDC